MPRLILALSLAVLVQLFGAGSALAVTWDTVSLSFSTHQSGDAKKVLTARTYVNAAVLLYGLTTRDYFVGYNESTGAMGVVRVADGILMVKIVYNIADTSVASNTGGRTGSAASSATVSNIETSGGSYLYDIFTKNLDGTFKTLKRTVIAGSAGSNLTIIGTARIGGRRYTY